MKTNLTTEQMAMVLFLLCKDVAALQTYDGSFYYFQPAHDVNLQAIEYILRKNGIKGKKHKSHYYAVSIDYTDKVFRVSKALMDIDANPKFKQCFDKVYSERKEYLQNTASAGNKIDKLFWMKSASGKAKILSRVLEQTI